MKSLFFASCLLFFAAGLAAAPVNDSLVSEHSPDGKLVFTVRVQGGNRWQYRIEKKGVQVLNWSSLGLVAAYERIPDAGLQFKSIERTAVKEQIRWQFGENENIRNAYRQLIVHARQQNGLAIDLAVRVYNADIAFRYILPANTALRMPQLTAELTGFVFNTSYTAYHHNIESVFTPVAIHALTRASDLPLVLAGAGSYVSINEAMNDQYAKVTIARGEEPNSAAIRFGKDTVIIAGNFATPWRTISFAASAAELAAHSDLLYKLNPPPPAGKKYDWVRPGKLIREMTLTTQGALDCIGFAADMHFQYMMFDAGWYGKGYAAEFDKDSDPHRVAAAIDMPRVIRYGKEKGIGIILYVNYVGLRKHNLDSLFSLYRSWGVKGLKFGFVNGLTQQGISWLVAAVRKAQDYGFIINVHDNYKPTGLSRSIPAWLAQEGVRGNENNPDAFHNTVLPFTRFLSGPADYTFCFRSQNDSFNHTLLDKKLQVSQAQQLALTVIFYSPLQSMLWYGRPAYYQKAADIEFFKEVPTTWDKTLHLSGEIGSYATTARRKNGTWYIGAAAAAPHEENIRLNFLEKTKKYTATLYTDDGSGGIKKTSRPVKYTDSLPLKIGAKEGVAVIITPAK